MLFLLTAGLPLAAKDVTEILILKPYLKSICFSIRLAVTTLGRRPVERECSSKLEEMSWVVISVSAAVPAPQQLKDYNYKPAVTQPPKGSIKSRASWITSMKFRCIERCF